MPPLIKKPSPEELSNLQRINDLYRFASSQTVRQMRKFREIVVNVIDEMGVPMDRYADEQDPALWKRFCEMMCTRRKFLLQYEDAWLLQVYFDMRVKKQLRHDAVPVGRGYFPYAMTKSRGEPSSSRRGIGSSPQPSAHSFPNLTLECATLSSSPTVVASSQGSQMFFTSSQTTLAPPSFSRPQEPSSNVVFVGCNECEHQLPLHLAGQNNAIKSLFGRQNANLQECIRVLCRAGMANDTHLRVFAKWPLACRKAFVDDLGADKHVERILSKLTYRSIPIENEAPTSGDSPISQASKIRQPMEEEWLSDPTKPLEFLLKAMDLPTNRGPFQVMVTAVTQEGALYLSTYRPSRVLFEGAVQDISKKNPELFERYENQWPVRFILRRLARELGVQAQDDHLNPTPSPFSSQSHSSVKPPSQLFTYSKPPLLKIAYTCPTHPGPDQAFVAPTVQRCLQEKGLTDLIPMFALMGTSTEERFEEFCGLSAVEKDEAVVDAGVKVNVFQSLALKLELWEAVMDCAP